MSMMNDDKFTRGGNFGDIVEKIVGRKIFAVRESPGHRQPTGRCLSQQGGE
jgi:hypothetical protein